MSGAIASVLAGGGFPAIARKDIVATHQIGGFVELSIERRGDVFTNISGGVDDTREYWPEWAGFPTPGISNLGDPYEVRQSTIGGPGPSSGNLPDTWIALNANRSWLYPTQLGLSQFIWQLEIRRVSDSAVIAIAWYSFSITGTP